MEDRGWRIQRPCLCPRSSILDPQFGRQLVRSALYELGVDQSLDRFEAAGVLLVEPGAADCAEFLVEKGLANARNLFGPDFKAEPIGGLIHTGLVEEPAPAERRRQNDEPAAGDGEHWPDRAVQVGG